MKRMFRSGIRTTAGFGLGAFSRDELDAIHYATLQLLQDTGIKVINAKPWKYFTVAAAPLSGLRATAS